VDKRLTSPDAVWDAESGGHQETTCYMEVHIPNGKGQFWGEAHAHTSPMTACRELCKNGRTDRDAVWGRTWMSRRKDVLDGT